METWVLGVFYTYICVCTCMQNDWQTVQTICVMRRSGGRIWGLNRERSPHFWKEMKNEWENVKNVCSPWQQSEINFQIHLYTICLVSQCCVRSVKTCLVRRDSRNAKTNEKTARIQALSRKKGVFTYDLRVVCSCKPWTPTIGREPPSMNRQFNSILYT